MLVFEVVLYCLDLKNGCKKKENVRFSKEMLSKFCKQIHVLVLTIDYVIIIPMN